MKMFRIAHFTTLQRFLGKAWAIARESLLVGLTAMAVTAFAGDIVYAGVRAVELARSNPEVVSVLSAASYSFSATGLNLAHH
jgi:hypothetical protein